MATHDPPKRYGHRGTRIHRDRRRQATDDYHEALMEDEIQHSVTIRFPTGHSGRYSYVPADIYCPHCSEREVWVEKGAGDYYVGPVFLCLSCEHNFTLQGPSPASETREQAIRQIREAES